MIFDFEVTRDSIELDTGIASTPTTFATAPGPAVERRKRLPLRTTCSMERSSTQPSCRDRHVPVIDND